MTATYTESGLTYRLTYTLCGGSLTCHYTSWLHGASEDTLDTATFSPTFGRLRARDSRFTPYFVVAALAALVVTLLWLFNPSDNLVDFPKWTLAAVFSVFLALISLAAVHPVRATWTVVNSKDGRAPLYLRHPRGPSPELDSFVLQLSETIRHGTGA